MAHRWAWAVVALAAVAGAAKIEHVVVLMEENRSFDHMMGFYNRLDPRVNGLTGNECQYRDVNDPSKGQARPRRARRSRGAGRGADARAGRRLAQVCVNQHGYDVGPDDPCHGHACTTEQIYGYDSCENPDQCGAPHMNGFVQNALGIKHNESNVISMFNTTTVPVISTLAQEFALFDNFFCSHPGPTYPNRQFVHSATAHGEQDDEVPSVRAAGAASPRAQRVRALTPTASAQRAGGLPADHDLRQVRARATTAVARSRGAAAGRRRH